MTAINHRLAELGQRYLSDPTARRHPDEFYADLLSGPKVHRIGGDLWLVAGHAEVDAALRDPRFSRERSAVGELAFLTTSADENVRQVGGCMHRMMLMQDPPSHTRLRRAHRMPFLPRGVRRWEGRIGELVEDLANQLPTSGAFDLKATFALPVPEIAICEILGVPHSDHRDWERWGAVMVQRGYDTPTEEAVRVVNEAFVSFAGYFRELIAIRRAQPGDDLLSELLGADPDNQLDDDELIGNFMLLVVAGHETTANAITSAVGLLLRHPEQWDRIVADPQLIGSAVEEAVRLEGAQRFTVPRVAVEDVPLGGALIPAGDRAIFLIEAANRDPAVFTDPLRYNITRSPNPHLAFGSGPHLCLGMHLARLEMNLALHALVRRFPKLQLMVAEHDLVLADTPTVRGWTALPVAAG